MINFGNIWCISMLSYTIDRIDEFYAYRVARNNQWRNV